MSFPYYLFPQMISLVPSLADNFLKKLIFERNDRKFWETVALNFSDWSTDNFRSEIFFERKGFTYNEKLLGRVFSSKPLLKWLIVSRAGFFWFLSAKINVKFVAILLPRRAGWETLLAVGWGTVTPICVCVCQFCVSMPSHPLVILGSCFDALLNTVDLIQVKMEKELWSNIHQISLQSC